MRTTTLLLFLSLLVPQSAGGNPDLAPQYVYVASTVLQDGDARVFSSFAITNTTRFWFNPDIYLIDREGRVIRHVAPLMKGFGTWHEISGKILADDFFGSVWVVSSQPLVINIFTHQVDEDGHVSLLASVEAKSMSPTAIQSIVESLAPGEVDDSPPNP